MLRRSIAIASTGVLLLLTCALSGIAVAPLFGMRAMVLTSGSMAPTHTAGGMVLVERVTPEEVAPGDVITYAGLRGGALTTHRVLSRHEVGGTPHFRTKGDANRGPDPDLAPGAAVVGRVVLDISPLAPALLALTGSRVQLAIPGLVALWLGAAEWRALRRLLRTVPQRLSRGSAALAARVGAPAWLVLPDERPPDRVAWLEVPGPSVPAPVEELTFRSTPPPRPALAVPVAALRTLVALGVLSYGLVGVHASAALLTDVDATSAESVATRTLASPTNVSATWGCTLLVEEWVDVSWDASADADEYDVERSVDGGPYSTVATVLAGTTTYQDATVTFDTTYDYVVRAVEGGWTADSAVASVTTPAVCS